MEVTYVPKVDLLDLLAEKVLLMYSVSFLLPGPQEIRFLCD